MSDRLTLAISRLASQFDDRINFIDLLASIIEQFDEVDNMLNDLLLLRTLNDAEGVWLDQVGEIVGIKRPSIEVPDSNRFAYCAHGDSPGNPFKGFSSTKHDPNTGDVLLNGNFEIDPSFNWHSSNATLEQCATNPHSGLYCGKVKAIAGAGSKFCSIYQHNFTHDSIYPIKGYVRSDGNCIPIIKNGPDIYWTGTTSTDYQYFEIPISILWGMDIKFGFNVVDADGSEFICFDDIEIDNGHYSSIDGLPLGISVSDAVYRTYILAKAIATYQKPTIRNIYAYIQNSFGVSCEVYNDDDPGFVLVHLNEALTALERRLLVKYAPVAAAISIEIINWP